MTVLLGL